MLMVSKKPVTSEQLSRCQFYGRWQFFASFNYDKPLD